MTHKNGRWALSILAIAIIAFVSLNESASAHLLSISLSMSDLLKLDMLTGQNSVEIDNGLVGTYATNPKEGGLYIASSLNNEVMHEFVNYISSIGAIKNSLAGTQKKIMVTDSSGSLADTFTSVKTGVKYALSLASVATEMPADGYFASTSDYGVIYVGKTIDRNKLFTVLLHEMSHAVQFSQGMDTGEVYNFKNNDVRKFSLAELRKSLQWVQSEIEAHLNTAYYIDSIITLPEQTKNELLQTLQLDENSLVAQKESELTKYSWYEEEESKIIDELIARGNIKSTASA